MYDGIRNDIMHGKLNLDNEEGLIDSNSFHNLKVLFYDLKEGCLMIIKGIKDLIKKVRFTGITLNIGFIGLNFAGGSS